MAERRFHVPAVAGSIPASASHVFRASRPTAGWRSPKPLIGVRVPAGAPRFSVGCTPLLRRHGRLVRPAVFFWEVGRAAMQRFAKPWSGNRPTGSIPVPPAIFLEAWQSPAQCTCLESESPKGHAGSNPAASARISIGALTERPKVAVWKTDGRSDAARRFKSCTLRQIQRKP